MKRLSYTPNLLSNDELLAQKYARKHYFEPTKGGGYKFINSHDKPQLTATLILEGNKSSPRINTPLFNECKDVIKKDSSMSLVVGAKSISPSPRLRSRKDFNKRSDDKKNKETNK